jgi:hypothetical protein
VNSGSKYGLGGGKATCFVSALGDQDRSDTSHPAWGGCEAPVDLRSCRLSMSARRANARRAHAHVSAGFVRPFGGRAVYGSNFRRPELGQLVSPLCSYR